MTARHRSDLTQKFRIAGVDIRDVGECSCLRLRKAARRATQIYELHMRPTGLTIGQFGVLGYLYGASGLGVAGLAVGALAERLGMDPTTLKRVIGPLLSDGLVVAEVDAADRRVRLLAITPNGRARLAAAVPLWQDAQAELQERLGAEARAALDHSVEVALAKMRAGA